VPASPAGTRAGAVTRLGAVSAPRPTFAQAARDLLRETLLDAARDLLAERPWSEITMADVARGAGVSRQTLYNEFGSREEFAQALILREVDRFLATVEQAVVDNRDDPTRALAAAFDVFLAAAAENPLVRAIVAGDGGDELLPLVTTHGGPVLERATERLAAILLESWPQVGSEEAELLAECVVRLAISYAALPQGPAGMTGDSVATLLGPYVTGVLERAGSG